MDNRSADSPDYGKLQKIATSPDGQRLLKLVQQHSGSQFEDAMHRAEAGDCTDAKNMLSQILSSAEAQELIRRIRGGT